MNTFETITAEVSSLLWGWPMIILLLGTHLFLTIRLRFPQRKIFTAIRLSVKRDDGAEGDVSQFGALPPRWRLPSVRVTSLVWPQLWPVVDQEPFSGVG